ncbi:hypothetical protein ETAE_1846 [Edwardsiella piscicida]|uniref:Uncharacterized protein n=1 Tax=Edwardsiella piscicida TaxID=1263550 RepID=A0AAU8P5L0_EDWPI|nr:hypothetical protein ETAE_1846 [Edwardsiella tarda EIB202]AGH73813.1 hypothetical protein ETAC_08460 [Edwardsiella piscicida C07-087]
MMRYTIIGVDEVLLLYLVMLFLIYPFSRYILTQHLFTFIYHDGVSGGEIISHRLLIC